jgi:hypothetical protein
VRQRTPSLPPTARISRRAPRSSPATSTSCSRPATTPPSAGSSHHEPDRVHVRDRQGPEQGHQGPGSRTAGLAMAFNAQGRRRRLRAAPGRPGPRRRDLRQRNAHRKARRKRAAGSRLEELDPQLLTNSPGRRPELLGRILPGDLRAEVATRPRPTARPPWALGCLDVRPTEVLGPSTPTAQVRHVRADPAEPFGQQPTRTPGRAS